jgi:tetratricopeptide (TPR) repeat protein
MTDQSQVRRKRTKRNRGALQTLLRSPSYWPIAAFECSSAWFFTRPKFQLLLTLPFLVVMLVFWLYTTWGIRSGSEEELQSHVRRAVIANAGGKSIAYEIACRRLLAMEMTDDNRFRVAMTFLAGKGEEQAERQLQLIAPEDGEGYCEAHLWFAAKILAGSGSDLEKPSDRLIHHARAAYSVKPNSPEAQATWGQIVFHQGKKIEGLSLLEQAAEKLPQINLIVAQLHSQMGSTENARRYMDRAEQHLRSALVRDNEDAAVRQSLIQVAMLKKDVGGALDIAEEGFRRSPSPATKQLLLETLGYVYDSMESEKRFGIEGLQLIRRSIEIETRDLNSLQRLIRIIVLQDDSQWDGIRKKLELEIAEGRSNATIQMILAIGYSDHDNERLSQFHIKQALIEDNTILNLGGNVALAGLEMNPPELTFSESWLKVLINTFPNRPELLEVRAKFYLADGKYEQAITDLNICLRQSKVPDRIRKLLVEAYEKNNQPDMAKKILDQVAPSADKQSEEDKVLIESTTTEPNK